MASFVENNDCPDLIEVTEDVAKVPVTILTGMLGKNVTVRMYPFASVARY